MNKHGSYVCLKFHTIFVRDKAKMAAICFFQYVILCILLDSASKQWTSSKIRAMFSKKNLYYFKNDKT